MDSMGKREGIVAFLLASVLGIGSGLSFMDTGATAFVASISMVDLMVAEGFSTAFGAVGIYVSSLIVQLSTFVAPTFTSDGVFGPFVVFCVTFILCTAVHKAYKTVTVRS